MTAVAGTTTPTPSLTRRLMSLGLLVMVGLAFAAAVRADDAIGSTSSTVVALKGSGVALFTLAQRVLHPLEHALIVDFVFVLAWLAVVPALLCTAVRNGGTAPWYRRGPIWSQLWVVAIVAGGLDLVENGALWLMANERLVTPFAVALAGVTWTKFVAYAVAVVGVLWLVVGPALSPWLRPVGVFVERYLVDRWSGPGPRTRAEIAPTLAPARGSESGIAICLSGGGIRSAAIALGALRALDEPNHPGERSLFRKARWLSAVSGGAYTATGWRLARRPNGGIDPPPSTVDGLLAADTKWFASVRARAQYLRNATGGFLGGLAGAAVRTTLILATLASLATAIGIALGRFVRSPVMYPRFPNGRIPRSGALTFEALTRARLVAPGVALVALGILVLLATELRPTSRPSKLTSPGLVLLGIGAAELALLVGVPLALRYGPHALGSIGQHVPAGNGAHATAGSGFLALLSTLGIVGAITKLLIGQVSKRALRLGGVLLGMVALLLVGKVANDVSYANGGFFSHRWTFVAIAVVIVAYELVPAHRQTLQGIYRKRLGATFALQPTDGELLDPLGYHAEPLWSSLGHPDLPEFITCATAHSTEVGPGGVKAHGFTFRPDGVRLFDASPEVTTFVPYDAATPGAPSYPTGNGCLGFPRGWIPTRSMAITGAAFASAMARQGLGTTNALLVACNLRLGCWIPNPKFAGEWSHGIAPRVHLGYLVKELFGRYHPDRDPFVYVADGGHRENLGLVDLLREHPTTVIVVDASGDTPGEFTTLREAIELARAELGHTITLDLDPLRRASVGAPLDHPFAGGPKDLPPTCVARGTIDYHDGTVATLLYGKSQVDRSASPELQAFAMTDPKFPDYSTGNQFLTDERFSHLVDLGAHVGATLRAAFRA